MAKQIEQLNAGQAPTLLDASKGNELINALNSLMSSGSSQKAELAGISLKVLESGRIELDISQEAAEILNPPETEEPEEIPTSGGGGGGIPSGFAQEQFTTIVNGIAQTRTFLTK